MHKVMLVTCVLLLILIATGCSAAQKRMPHVGIGSFSLEGNMERKDFVIMGSVEGSSQTTSILCGLVQMIDGDNLKLFGIPFFTDKFTYFSEDTTFSNLTGIRFVTPEDRAYYKALEKTPDADVVLVKSMDRESFTIPFIYGRNSVPFRGKAMELKHDR